jgi:hypothetical protein
MKDIEGNNPRRGVGMTRRDVLRYTTAGALTAAFGGFATRAATAAAPVASAGEGAAIKRPNVLLVICDQLGFDAMSWAGCSDVSTPNIDRLRS